MQRNLLLLFCSILFAAPVFGQKKELKTKFGKISDEEMAMKSYADDPAAPAVVLFDKGRITHDFFESTGFAQTFDRHVRIKIFKKEAYEYADLAILFFPGIEKISDLKASCYNLENGKLVETELQKANIFDEKITKGRSMRKFTIPGVKEGSIIEYKYSIIREDVGIRDWVFQHTQMPTIWSEYQADVPVFLEYRKSAQGWVPFTLSTEEVANKFIMVQSTKVDYRANSVHFIQENVPALKPEEYVASPKDYLSQINFEIKVQYNIDLVQTGSTYQIVTTTYKENKNKWEVLGADMLDDVYDGFLKSKKYTEESTQKCVEGKSTNAEKVAAIYQYIGENYQRIHYDYVWMSQDMESLNKTHKGIPTDLNLLFVNMLRRAGIKANPVMLSTRSNGHVFSFRVALTDMNRVIASVEIEDNAPVLIDVSGWPNPIGLLPEQDLNNEGLLLKAKDDVSWVPLQNKIAARTAVMGDLNISPEGKMNGNITFSNNGYKAVDARKSIAKKDAPAYINEQYKNLLEGGSMKDLSIENTDKWQEAGIKGTFKMETTANVTVAGDKIYLVPALGFGLKENPFNNPERKFNVDLDAPHDEIFNFTIKLPAGYKVEELPKGAKMVFGENALTFDYLLEATPEQIKVNIRQKFKINSIEVDKYEDLRSFYSSLVAKLQEQVVLTKM